MESSQHHVGGVQWVDEVWWESILLFNCVRPPEKGENKPNVGPAVGTCTFMCSNMKQGFSWNLLASEAASLRTVPLVPSEVVGKTMFVHAICCIKELSPPEDIPIKIQSRLQSYLTNFCRNRLSMWRERCRNCCYTSTALKEEDLTCDIMLT